MSHWVKYQSDVLRNTDLKLLEKALNKMDITLDHTIKNIRNTWGNAKVDFALITNQNWTPSLGFKEVNEDGDRILELHGDFFATGLNESTFMDRLSQQYQEARITDILENNGWSIEDVIKNEEDEIVINAYQMAY